MEEDKTPWKVQRGWGPCGVYYYMYTDKGKCLESAYVGALEQVAKERHEKSNL